MWRWAAKRPPDSSEDDGVRAKRDNISSTRWGWALKMHNQGEASITYPPICAVQILNLGLYTLHNANGIPLLNYFIPP